MTDFPNAVYAKNGSIAAFGDVLNVSTPGLATMFDENGNLCWNAHNQLLYSNDLEAVQWTKQNVTISASVETSPSDLANVFTIANDATSGEHRAYRVIAGVSYQRGRGIFAKAGTANFIGISNGNTGTDYAVIDLSDGSISAQYLGAETTVTPVVDGWYFIKLITSSVISEYSPFKAF